MPLVFDDEAAYIQAARRLAAGLAPYNLGNKFFPGFSILLAPLFFFSLNVEVIYPFIQILNVVINSFLPLLIWCALKIVAPAMKAQQRLGVTALTALYPAFLLQSSLALVESVLVTLYGLLILSFLHVTGGKPGKRPWLTCVVLVFVLPMFHGRAIGISLAAALTLGLHIFSLGWHRGSRWRPLASAALLLILAVGLWQVVSIVMIKKGAYGFTGEYFADILTDAPGERFANALLSAVGTLWYLSAASCGLIWIGWYDMLRYIARRTNPRGLRLVAGFCITAFLAVFAITKASDFVTNQQIKDAARGDWLIYGRYLDVLALPFLMLGLLRVSRDRISGKLMGGQIALTTVLGLLIYGYRGQHLDAFTLNWYQILGIAAFNFDVSASAAPLATAAVLAQSAALTTALAVSAYRWPKLALLLVGLYFVSNATAGSAYMFFRHQHLYENLTVTRIMPALNTALAATDNKCVFYQPQRQAPRSSFFAMFVGPDVGFRTDYERSTKDGATPCPLNLAGSAQPKYHPYSRILGVYSHGDYLWGLDKEFVRPFVAQGRVLPEGFPSMLSDAAYKAEITPTQVACGDGHLCFDISVKHAGREFFWPGNGLLQGSWGVALTYEGISSKDFRSLGRGIYDFAWNQYPGEERTFRLTIGDRKRQQLCARGQTVMRFELEHFHPPQTKAFHGRPFSQTTDQAAYLPLDCGLSPVAGTEQVALSIRQRIFRQLTERVL